MKIVFRLNFQTFYGQSLWVESSPSLHGDVIYIGSSGSQTVFALEAQTGKLGCHVQMARDDLRLAVLVE